MPNYKLIRHKGCMFICEKIFRKSAEIVKIADTYIKIHAFPHKRAIYFFKRYV